MLDLTRPAVMGVLNITADSFSDGGRNRSLDAAIQHGAALVAEGAAIVDVGGESTRPGAEPVGLQEELDRVVPVVEALAGRFDALISVDTMKPQVMTEAVKAGAGLINDVLALSAPGALEAAAASGAAVCLMHMQGTPRPRQDDPRYAEVVGAVGGYLRQRAATCVKAGIASERICIDPGFGFGKNLEHNLQLLSGLPRLTAGLWPVLVGLSRKSMLGKLTGRPVTDRLAGSLALATIATLHGARIVRAHDVAATRDAVAVAWAARQQQQQGDYA
ncbi:MAG TPA: dihydropteroate synthase [Steroidobacteraceae bacterium]|nr:dihydropteroate synthase [Steroidobacteraceae bacterium]